MNPTMMSSLLFAQLSNWQRLGDGIHRGRGRMDLMDMLPVVIVVAVVAIAITIFVKVRKDNDMSQHCNDPGKLFRELSLAHQLDRADQKLLWRLAEALQLAQPAEVFLQPAYYEASIPQSLRDEQDELLELRQRLF